MYIKTSPVSETLNIFHKCTCKYMAIFISSFPFSCDNFFIFDKI